MCSISLRYYIQTYSCIIVYVFLEEDIDHLQTELDLGVVNCMDLSEIFKHICHVVGHKWFKLL